MPIFVLIRKKINLFQFGKTVRSFAIMKNSENLITINCFTAESVDPQMLFHFVFS